MQKMICPQCKTNKSRFYIIEQHPKAVKLNASSGVVEEEGALNGVDPFFIPYKGPDYLIQCGLCGLIEQPTLFEKAAENL